MAACCRFFLFVLGDGSVDVSYLWKVKNEGLVVSVFRGVGGDLCVNFRVVCGCVWLS